MFKVTAKHDEGMSFEMSQDGHKFFIDSSAEHGGKDKGVRPKALVASALAGCTAMDVTSLLGKMRVPFDTFEVEVETDYVEEHPKVFTDIMVRYKFTGDELVVKKVKRAVELSEEKYCGVSAMLKNDRKIENEIYINGEKV